MAVIFLLFIITYSIITFISHHFLSKSIELIKQKLNLSQIVASITLVATANCLPDLLLSGSSESLPESNHFILATILSDFIFSMTITVAYVVYKSSRDFSISGKNMIKELIFYLISILLIIGYIY